MPVVNSAILPHDMPIESELLKLLGSGSAQVILVAGFIPAFVAIKMLWSALQRAQDKLVEMLAAKFQDAANAKDLLDKQSRLIEELTRTVGDLKLRIEHFLDEQRRKP